MKRPTFFHGVIVAALLAIAASAVVAAFVPVLGTVTVARILIPGLAFAYLYYLLSQSGERTGRVTTLVLWSVMTLLTWWFVPSFALYLLIHTGAIWLVRSLYFYTGVFPALVDLALNGLCVVIALGTLARTGSVFLATWSFFLVQALFIAIPRTMLRRSVARPSAADDAFEGSRRQAEAALRQLIAR